MPKQGVPHLGRRNPSDAAFERDNRDATQMICTRLIHEEHARTLQNDILSRGSRKVFFAHGEERGRYLNHGCIGARALQIRCL